MRKIYTFLVIFLFAQSASAQTNISFGGQAVQDAPGLSLSQTGILLVDTDGSGFDSLTSLDASLSTTESSTYGASFYVLADHTVSTFLGATSLSGEVDTFTLGNIPASSGDSFGYLVYAPTSPSPYSTTVAGDSFAVWTDTSWKIPGTSGAFSFGSEFSTLGDAADFSGTVIPEPSAYATILGLLGFGYAVFCRRRRSSSQE